MKTSLDQLPRISRKKPAEARHNIIPEAIRLPDGRLVSVKDILVKPRNRENYNLRTGHSKRVGCARNGTAPLKYTLEERVWLSLANKEDIARRYQISIEKAQGLKYTSRYVVDKLGIDTPKKE